MAVSTWSLGGVSFAFLVVRCWIRRSQKKFWFDDIVLIISWVSKAKGRTESWIADIPQFMLLGQLILNQLSINLGFGKHALDIDFSHFERITYYGASALTFSITGIILSKISFGLTLLRLTDGWLKAYVWFAIATLALFAIPVAVLPWVLCKPITKTFVDILPGTCIDKEPSVIYGRFQAIWAAIMDISLALLPWKVLWNLQMRTAEKIGVGVAMSLGILAGVTSILRARYVEQLQTQDLSYQAYNSVIWSTADTAMTVVATSIPVLRVFFKQAVNTAISHYHNSTNRSNKSKSTGTGSTPSNPSNNASTLANQSARRLNKNTSRTLENTSTDSLFKDDDLERGPKEGYIELDDLIVDEKTGRVSAATPESLPESMSRAHLHGDDWPLADHIQTHIEDIRRL
ncbi:uncharacterized protein J4E87_006454 [Alternaria ethzedia]|uniref:uncharacterized protein n=1 Tax=Alternaria ethzedia TaxID=181014 RepID=UPI0020C587BB|nr:uncharacterized protein J4E87_006454 [Alternaria ethzedia]KAI4622512.1 hypothetical protein J4E87_006454 [Alternaria ethzedia]KAI4710857.1 hypothetical protein J4E89_004447 [Alternaria sp. Ai002NY15]